MAHHGLADPREFIEQVYEAVRAADIDRLVGYFAEDCEFVDFTQPTPAHGRQALREYMAETWVGLPDFRPDRWTFTASGNRVAAELELVGVHQGSLFGYPPTGRVVRWPASAFYTLNDTHDQIVREAYYYDFHTLSAQLQGGTSPDGDSR